eukprot:429118_1
MLRAIYCSKYTNHSQHLISVQCVGGRSSTLFMDYQKCIHYPMCKSQCNTSSRGIQFQTRIIQWHILVHISILCMFSQCHWCFIVSIPWNRHLFIRFIHLCLSQWSVFILRHKTNAFRISDTLSNASNAPEIQLINTTNTKEKQMDSDAERVEDNLMDNDKDTVDAMILNDIMKPTNVSVTNELITSGREILHLFQQFNVWCLLPLCMYSGLEMAFDSADFPVLIVDNT